MSQIDRLKKSLPAATAFCGWLKKDVPANECHKPKPCFYRDEDDKPVECAYLKEFVRQRNKELGL